METRPNQMFACALEYSPLTEEEKANVMDCVKKELLTARGIRTLSPKSSLYKGVYDGDQNQRDHAYHQGSTRVWLLTFYIEAMLRLYGGMYGDPPHNPHGAISSAVATASLLRSEYLMDKYKKEEL